MNFWKNLWEFLRNRHVLNDTKMELTSVSHFLTMAEIDLEESQEKVQRLSGQVSGLESKLNFTTHLSNAYRAALFTTCPKLASVEEMKQLYETIAPDIDPNGFTLYHMAELITGTDACMAFSYEDNQGMFEEADGHQLLRYLTAAYFHAVKWDVVPGTCHEKATLLEVDTTSPEYRDFEQKLYRKVLERLGFQDILAPDREAVRETARSRQAEQKRGDAR